MLFTLVIANIQNSEIIPLDFKIMNLIKQNFKVKLKGILGINIMEIWSIKEWLLYFYIADLDKNVYSKWITREEIKKVGINIGNGFLYTRTTSHLNKT